MKPNQTTSLLYANFLLILYPIQAAHRSGIDSIVDKFQLILSCTACEQNIKSFGIIPSNIDWGIT